MVPIHPLPKMKRARRAWRLRARIVMLLGALGATSGMMGCRQLPYSPTSDVPPPLASVTTNDLPNAGLYQNQMPPITTIVRGQDGGFGLPPGADEPTSNVPADGGRHDRVPMGVSGQPATRVAQNPSPANPIAGAPGAGTLPPPSTGVYTNPGTVPGTTAPNGYSGVVPNAPLGVMDAVPNNYEALPEIFADDLSMANAGQPPAYTPRTQTADIIVNGYPARTGRIMFGGAVNSDAGVTGQITIEERNFDITRFPNSFQDLVGGTAFRGAGQTFRIEAAPGSQIKRYAVSFSEPYLFGYMPISMSVSGSLFDRRYNDWDEERGGGRLSFGYRITPDLSISAGVRAESIKITRPRLNGIQELDSVLGTNALYSGQLRLTHDTRNSPFAPSEGHYLDLTYEQAFGDFDFPRAEISLSKYFLLRERADGSGRQTLTAGWSVGFSGTDTPIFENFYAGGYTTLRGFEFRGASPTVNGVQVGGRFQLLGTFEYMFPLTADDMLRGVAFLDYGTVERDIEINRGNFRVSPGFGLRVAVPALGPAPLAFDFAFPVDDAAGDQRQTFSFFMGLNRRF
jgi:outer membrane protein insertion porin family